MSFSAQDLEGQPATPAAQPAAAQPAAQPAVPASNSDSFSEHDLGGPAAPAAPHTPQPGEATIGVYRPKILGSETLGTIFDRVETAFRNANPNTRPNIQEADKEANRQGYMQLINPEDLLSESGKQDHPMLAEIGKRSSGFMSC